MKRDDDISAYGEFNSVMISEVSQWGQGVNYC